MSTPNDPPQGPYWQQPQQPSQGPYWQQPQYPPQAPPPGYAPGPYQQPPQPPRRKRHTARTVLLSVCGVIVLIIVIAVAASGGKKGGPSAGGAAASPGAPAASSAPAKTKAKSTRQTVTYEVSGSNAQVTYGPTGSGLNGSVPMHITRTLHDPEYYSISAQLQGSGAVTCKIRVDGKVLSTARATGSYNIAQCEIVKDPVSGNWQSANG